MIFVATTRISVAHHLGGFIGVFATRGTRVLEYGSEVCDPAVTPGDARFSKYWCRRPSSPSPEFINLPRSDTPPLLQCKQPRAENVWTYQK